MVTSPHSISIFIYVGLLFWLFVIIILISKQPKQSSSKKQHSHARKNKSHSVGDTTKSKRGTPTEVEKTEEVYYQGYFAPTHPEKYLGDTKNIIFRSSLELKMMRYLDKHPAILAWQSEEMCIRYFHPHYRRFWRYFPDFIIQTKDEVIVAEVKPHAQRYRPDKSTSPDAYADWLVNRNKWAAARKWCKQNGWRFTIVTEKHLNKLRYTK